jgi:DNA-binding transcriptional regulator YdaS (Cro superfamily)
MLAKRKRHPMTQGLALAVAAAGSKYMLAKKLKLTAQAVQKWREVPVGRLLEIERITGVDRTKLRPDLFERG